MKRRINLVLIFILIIFTGCKEKIVDSGTQSMHQIIFTYHYGFKPAPGSKTGYSIRVVDGELKKHDRFCCNGDSTLVAHRTLDAGKLDSLFKLFRMSNFFSYPEFLPVGHPDSLQCELYKGVVIIGYRETTMDTLRTVQALLNCERKFYTPGFFEFLGTLKSMLGEK